MSNYHSGLNTAPMRLLAVLSCWAISTTSSQALPSFARQTGDTCAACHVGSFGPQLTPHGIAFKLAGYTDSNDQPGNVPLSAMLIGSWTHTRKDQPEGAGPHDGANNNGALQEAALFLAGGLTEHVGGFIQTTYSDLDRRQLVMDNLDVRYAQTVELGSQETLLGLSINNNPSLSDPFHTLPAWRFPFIASELTPGMVATPILDGGLEQQVAGLTAYGFWNNQIYAELGGYTALAHGTLETLNILAAADRLDKIDGVAPYGRLGYYQSGLGRAWHVGVFGFAPHIKPDGSTAATDQYQDTGLDASFQLLGNRIHVFNLDAAYTHEARTLNAAWSNASADSRKGHINRFDLNGSYYYDQTWGLTAGVFDIQGNTDFTLYADASRSGRPNTSGYRLQVDWSPFGKEESWAAPWANLRLGLQYTGYSKFNGAKSDYDGNGRDAHDNDTLFAFLWTAF